MWKPGSHGPLCLGSVGMWEMTIVREVELKQWPTATASGNFDLSPNSCGQCFLIVLWHQHTSAEFVQQNVSNNKQVMLLMMLNRLRQLIKTASLLQRPTMWQNDTTNVWNKIVFNSISTPRKERVFPATDPASCMCTQAGLVKTANLFRCTVTKTLFKEGRVFYIF